MGKLHDRLQLQRKTEYRQDAEDCLKIYNMLLQIQDGHVWDSTWRPLVGTIYKGFLSDERRYKPTNIGYIFINGIENKRFTEADMRRTFRAGMEREAALRRGMPELALPEDRWIAKYT